MNPWDLDANLRIVVIDFLILSSFILLGSLARRYIKFFQRYLVPNNFIGGFLALIMGREILGWIDLDPDRLILYVYHLLALTFICLGLRQSKTKWGKGPFSKSMNGISSYLLQALVGLAVAFILVKTVMPDLFIGIGLVVPLGFGMGPGLAATIAGSWEKYGFEGGAQVGLTFATVGYMYAFFLGMALIHWGIRTKKTALIKGTDHISEDMRRGLHHEKPYPVAGHLPQSTEAIEPFSFHIALVGLVYLLTYLAVLGFEKLLLMGNLTDLVDILWGFHFIIGLLIAIGVRKLFDVSGRGYQIDSGLMTRSMGLFLDYLVVGAVAGISITVIGMYWLPILIMSLIAGPATMFMFYYTCYRAFDDYHFERFVELFGEMTGTINSALVLLKVLDPELKTPVAEDAAYGSGISLFIGIPLLFGLGVAVAQNSEQAYWILFFAIIAYWALWIGIWRLMGFIHFRKREV